MKNLIITTFLFLVCLPIVYSQCNSFEFPQVYDRKEILLGAHHDPCGPVLLSAPRCNRSIVLSNNIVFTGLLTRYETCQQEPLPFTALYEITFADSFSEEEEIISVPVEESIEVTLADGEHSGNLRLKTIEPDGDYQYSDIIEFSLLVKSSASTYEVPDEIWTVNTAETFVPTCSNGYSSDPSNRWYSYSQPSTGFAKAYIKYGNDASGQKHQKLTRPIILVEGVDFPTYQITDSEVNDVVRIGTNGWENVIQGLLPSKLPEGEAELFAEYPGLMTDLRSTAGGSDISQYDIVLVDFGDGADYMDKNAEIVIELIKRINQEKECQFENVILGLSMGGQVARLALTFMEERGEDHQCRQYISFDSPHENATIPLAIQAFAFTNAFFSDDACGQAAQQAGDFWFYLNKPAAKQMLSERFLAEFQKGNIQYEIIEKDIEIGIYNVGFAADINHSIYSYFDNSLDHNCLFQEYQLLKERVGYPKLCKNVAIANGSGEGYDALPEVLQGGDELCLFKGYGDLDLNQWAAVGGASGFLLQRYLDFVGENVIAKMIMNAMPGLDTDILDYGTSFSGVFYETLLPRIKQQDMIVAKFKIHSTPFLNYEIAPGCERNDIQASIRPAFMALDDAILDTETPCWSNNATFMPTYSVIGFPDPPGNFSKILDLLDENRNLSPFDEVHLPALNQPHVKVNEGNSSFLFGEINTAISTLPPLSELPSQDLGKLYNFVNSVRRVSSFTINKSGTLGFNLNTDAGFENYPVPSLQREEYFCSLGANECFGNSVININAGGRMLLGDEINSTKSAHLQTLQNTEININGGELKLANSSSLKIVEGSRLFIETGSIINLSGIETEILIAGDLITTGDVEINCSGKITIASSANLQVGGKLTINGHDVSSDLLSIAGHHTLDQSININNGTITMIADAQLEIISSPSSSQNTVNFQSVILKQEGMHSAFGSRLKFKNLESITIDDFVAKDMPNSIVVDMQQISNIELSNLKFTNCYKALQAKNIDLLNLEESEFTSIPVSSTGADYEGFNGVSLSSINTVQLSNCTYDGFGQYGSNTDYLYALELIDCPQVDIADSEFTNNKTGINVPQDADQKNNTNLFITNSLFQDNYAGIEMYGYASDAVNIKSSGYLNMECVRMLDNYYGVDGEDILLQADFYFAGEESSANTFKPRTKNDGGGSPVSFHITYTTFSYDNIYLRGNIWYDFASTEAIVNADGTAADVIKSPGVDAGTSPVEIQCASVQLDDDCIGCFQQEDDDDCSFALDGKNTNIASIYRQANSAVRNRDFDLVEELFTPLSTIASNNSIGESAPKCNYQTHIARVFALPTETQSSWGIDNRSSSKAQYSVIPNPSSESIILEGLVDSKIWIYASSGNQVLTANYKADSVIDVSSFEAGLYIVRSDKSNETQKFIVVK